MKQLLFNTLNTICPGNVFLQGTVDADVPYPESFITFFTDYTEDRKFFDDDVASIDWSFTVIFYSSDPELIASVPAEITTALKAQGFIPQGRGRDIPSDVPTHTGWAMEFIITEYLD
jgi:hypothetical protein